MAAETEETNTRIDWGIFGPEDLAAMRSGLDQAWTSLAPEGRTLANRDVLAAAIIRVAARGERDPVHLSALALRAIMPESSRECFDLEVREGEETVAAVRSIELPNPAALWSRIAELAKAVYAPGRTIRVTNQLGEMVILIGVASAIRHASSLGIT
jgi:hypothetical protein